jgi:hypothetical protein
MNERQEDARITILCDNCAVATTERIVREAVEPFYDDASAPEELSECVVSSGACAACVSSTLEETLKVG